MQTNVKLAYKLLYEELEYALDADAKSLDETVIKLTEEVGEFAGAHLIENSTSGTKYRNAQDPREDVLEELVDVMVVAVSYAVRKGFTPEELERMTHTKVEKWLRVSLAEKE